jgi:hypothetical protein
MLKEIGCEFTTSNVRDPPQNGRAERSNRILIDLARSNLADSKLKNTLWEEAVLFSCQVLNAITINKETNQSAFEIFHRRKPYFGKFYPFGTKCFFLNQSPDIKKFTPPGIEGILVGLNAGVFGYRIWVPGTRKVVVTKHVSFPKINPLNQLEEAEPSEGESAFQEEENEEENEEEEPAGSSDDITPPPENEETNPAPDNRTPPPVNNVEPIPAPENVSTDQQPSTSTAPDSQNDTSSSKSKKKKRKRKEYPVRETKMILTREVPNMMIAD